MFILNMVKINESFILSYKKDNQIFQVLVDYNKLLDFREKKEINIFDVLADTDIYIDTKKGLRQSEKLIKNIFKEKTEEEVLTEILEKGDCQVPTKYLNQQREKIKEKIVQYIIDNCINPQTNGKFTSSMIKTEIDKISFSFNPDMDFINQAEKIIKKLQLKFPIKIDLKSLLITIPAKYTNKFYNKNFRGLGKITKEFYDNYGSLKLHMDVNSSNFENVISYIKLNSNNEGEYHL
jgi:rRNA metabolism SBDS family protein